MKSFDEIMTAAVRRPPEADLAKEEKYAARGRYCARMAAAVNPRPEKPATTLPVSNDEILRMSSYADAGFYEGPEIGEEVSREDRAFAFSANGAFLGLCRERTGEFQDDEKQAKHERQSAELLQMSEALCQKMATAADPSAVRELCFDFDCDVKTAREVAPRFNPYRQDTGFELRRYYLHSRQVDLLPNYRRIRFIPYVAQALRAPLVSALDFWLSKNPFARFWTFTSGVRVQLSGVADRAKWLHDKLRKLNKRQFMQRAGVEIVFRSTELGTPETNERGDLVDGGRIEYDETGQNYFHVHAHCVVELTKGPIRGMSGKRDARTGEELSNWDVFLGRVHKFWGFRWQDDGAIQSSREVCKYVTKPGEMLQLSGDELVLLEEQLSGVRLIETAGSLRKEMSERDEAGERLIKRKTPDGRVYFVVKDWNKHVRRTRTEEGQDAAQKLTPKDARGLVRVISRGACRFGRSGVAEPVVTTLTLRGSWNEGSVRSHALVAPVIRATVHQYFEGVARRAAAGFVISVHTRTPTVPEVWAERPARPRGKPKQARMGAARAGF